MIAEPLPQTRKNRDQKSDEIQTDRVDHPEQIANQRFSKPDTSSVNSANPDIHHQLAQGCACDTLQYPPKEKPGNADDQKGDDCGRSLNLKTISCYTAPANRRPHSRERKYGSDRDRIQNCGDCTVPHSGEELNRRRVVELPLSARQGRPAQEREDTTPGPVAFREVAEKRAPQREERIAHPRIVRRVLRGLLRTCCNTWNPGDSQFRIRDRALFSLYVSIVRFQWCGSLRRHHYFMVSFIVMFVGGLNRQPFP